MLSVFAAAFFILFLGMSLYPNVYDESLVLTAAMRVAAGQVPHRDFYAIWQRIPTQLLPVEPLIQR